MFLPFLAVLGITAIAGAIATAIHHPHEHLPLGSGAALGVGLALFYGTNAAEALRFGQAPRLVARWAPLAVALSLGLVPLSTALSATGTLTAAVAVLFVITSITELRRRAALAP